MALAGTKLGPYEITGQVGAGGMGEVYRGRDTRLGRQVAIKILPAPVANDTDRLHRFELEARAAAAFNHPNICALYDIGQEGEIKYLVMEYLEGENLASALHRGPLPVERAIQLGVEVAGALQEAHAHGLVHRDIKPANILITARGESKVLDFGIAKLAADGSAPELPTMTGLPQTAPHTPVGTPPYMSPEQVQGLPVDGRSDVFSLGVVLYEALTGTLAFRGETTVEILYQVVKQQPVPVRQLNASVPAPLEAAVAKALEKDPALRYQSAAELRADLMRIHRAGADGESLAPRSKPDSRPGARRAVWAAIAVLVVAAAIGAILAVRRPSASVASSVANWTQVTDFPDSVTSPALSPDGRMLAFLRGADAFFGAAELYVKLLPDGTPVRLTSDHSVKMSPAFSPDGTRIAYTVIDQGFGWETYVAPALGGVGSQLLMRNAAALTWIDAHQFLMSAIAGGAHMGIVTAGENRTNERQIYLPASTRGMAHRSALSPDRKWVLIAEMGQSGTWLPCRLVLFDGGGPGREVGPDKAACTEAAWSPDGKWMYFSADAGKGFHLWRQGFPSGAPEQITFGPTQEQGLAMDPSGKSLITAAGIEHTTVWLHDRNGERQLSAEGDASAPMFLPDGKHLLYLVGARQDIGVGGHLFEVDLANGSSEELLPGFSVVSFDLSADWRQVAFTAVSAAGQMQVWTSPLDRSQPPRQVVPEDADSPVFGPDGDLYFRRRVGHDNYLFHVNGDGTNEGRVYGPILQIVAASPKHDLLSMWMSDPEAGGRTGLVLLALRTGRTQRICATCMITWSPDGSSFAMQPSNSTPGGANAIVFALPKGEEVPRDTAAFEGLPFEQLRRRKDVQSVIQAEPAIGVTTLALGPGAKTFALVRTVDQRNLYRIPLR